MTRYLEIIKWSTDAAHDATPIRLQCPCCRRETRRKIRTFKNLQALSYHISTEHKDEKWIYDAKCLITAISTALNYGVICK